MSEDREQERAEERGHASRPVTAAARRERRASARPATKRDRGSRTTESTKGGATAGGSRGAVTPGKGRPTPSRDRRESKGSLFQRIGRFLREVVAELRKVMWPTRKQMVTYTVVVLFFVAFMVALVAALDFGFTKGVFWLFG